MTYYVTAVVLTLVGLLDSLYLAYAHYQNYTNPTYSSFCAISNAINCDTVAQSNWSIFWGIPVALWGVFGYLLFLFFLMPLRKCKKMVLPLWNVMVLIAMLFSLAAIHLGYISASRIHSYCIFCLISYAISFALFYVSWLIQKRFCSTSLSSGFVTGIKVLLLNKIMVAIVFVLMSSIIALHALIPRYWNLSLSEVTYDLAQGITQDGHPWIGARRPVITINEFSDYMCFQCKKMHFLIRQLVKQYPERIRLVHHHFPMDHTYNPLVKGKFHSGSGKMAIIAIYASAKNQFWKINDLLFDIAGQKTDFNTRMIADVMKIPVGELASALRNRSLRMMLKHDIAVGIKHGLQGTPGFLIEGKMYLGTIPKEILEKTFNDNEIPVTPYVLKDSD